MSLSQQVREILSQLCDRFFRDLQGLQGQSNLSHVSQSESVSSQVLPLRCLFY